MEKPISKPKKHQKVAIFASFVALAPELKTVEKRLDTLAPLLRKLRFWAVFQHKIAYFFRFFAPNVVRLKRDD